MAFSRAGAGLCPSMISLLDQGDAAGIPRLDLSEAFDKAPGGTSWWDAG